MSPATPTTKVSPSTSGARNAKQKSSKTIILKISPSILARFAPPKPDRKPSQPKPTPVSNKTPVSPIDTASSANSKVEIKMEPKTTSPSKASDKPSLPVDEPKRKGPGGNKAGVKRPFSSISEGLSKPRAKPGPKKRKTDYGTADNNESTNRPWTTPAPITGHKLGPKANQGAINAGLRALDRTGKPCRKWTKQSFAVKSFTGVTWELPSWRAPKKVVIELKVEPGQSGTPTSNSENQVNQSSSNPGTDNSHNGNSEAAHVASSPVPGIAVSA